MSPYSDGNEPTGNVTIPKSFTRNTYTYTVTEIGRGVFQYCKGITSVTISDGITWIGKNAFFECRGITSVSIPGSVKEIEKNAFWRCTGLKTVTVHWKKPLAVPNDVFKSVNTANVTLNVPKGTKKAYQAAAVWKTFRIDDGTPDVVPVTGVTLNHHKVTVNADITQKPLTVTVKPANATNKSVRWKSNNPAVDSVDAD